MTFRNWNTSNYINFNTPDAWASPGVPGPGDSLVMRSGAAWLWGSNLIGATIFAGSNDAAHPAYLWTGYSSLNISLGLVPSDQPLDSLAHRNLAITAYGANDIHLTDTGYKPGGGGTVSMTLLDGSTTHLTGAVSVHSSLSVSGPGQLSDISLDSWEGSMKISSDLVGASSINFYGSDEAELGGAVAPGGRMAFTSDHDHLTIDKAAQFGGYLDASAATGSLQIDLDGIAVDTAAFAYDHLILAGPDGYHQDIHLTLPTFSHAIDVYATTTGIMIGNAAPPDVSRLLLHATTTTT